MTNFYGYAVFIGHVGTENGELYFIEKVAFQEHIVGKLKNDLRRSHGK